LQKCRGGGIIEEVEIQKIMNKILGKIERERERERERE